MQNKLISIPVVGSILSQVNASQISEKEVKILFAGAEGKKIKIKFEALR